MDGGCRHCGFGNDPGAKFCGGCGRALGREGEVTHPQFVTGKKGRPYCAAHTSFDGRRLEEYDSEELVRPVRAHSLACTTCEHYSKDDCYFSVSSIDAVTEDIFKRRMLCDLCTGWYVVSPVVVLQKIYWEQVSGGKGYIACPHCDRFLKTGQNSRTRYGSLLVLSLALPLETALFILTVSLMGVDLIALIVALGVAWVYIVYRYYHLFVAFPEKRRNLKDCRRALDQGRNLQIFLAVD